MKRKIETAAFIIFLLICTFILFYHPILDTWTHNNGLQRPGISLSKGGWFIYQFGEGEYEGMSRVGTSKNKRMYEAYLDGSIEWTEWDSEHKAYIEYAKGGISRP